MGDYPCRGRGEGVFRSTGNLVTPVQVSPGKGINVG